MRDTWTFARGVLIVTVCALSVTACHKGEEENVAPVVTVDVAPVLSSKIQQTVRADALLYPVQQAAIVPKITAPV